MTLGQSTVWLLECPSSIHIFNVLTANVGTIRLHPNREILMSSRWSQETYVKAWDFATVAHHGHTYEGPIEGQQIDYINHVGSVAMELIWALSECESVDGDLSVQCALLHDVIEHTEFTYDQVRSAFGQAVADGVSALTKNESLPTEYEQMVDSLVRIKQQPTEVWMVKLADRITNMSAPPSCWSREKMIFYQNEARLILEQLGSANKLLKSRLSSKIDSYQVFIERV